MKKMIAIVMMITILIFSITGCSPTNSSAVSTTEISTESSNDENSTTENSDSTTLNWDDLTNEDIQYEYSKKDLDATWNASESTKITLNGTSVSVDGDGAKVDGTSIVITAAGTYVFSGTLDEGQILVTAGETDDVHLVFNTVTLHNSTTAPLHIISADKVVLTLADGSENKLSDGDTYVLEEGSDEPDATIFSKQDLTINGSGTLAIEANYNHGIDTKDDLVIVGSNLIIHSKNDAIRGKDSVVIHSGTLELTAGGDAIQSYQDSDLTKGYVLIDGGMLYIESEDDAIHAETHLVIHDGDIEIAKSYEGLEARMILVTGGDVTLNSSDDGINAAGSVSTDETSPQQGKMGMAADGGNYEYKQTGGSVYMSANGDGLDSNGVFYIEGGAMTIDGPVMNGNGALDYTSVGSVNGGTLIAAGSSGMAQTPSSDSTLNALMICFSTEQSANTKVELKNSAGETVLSHTPSKTFQTIVFSDSDLELNQTYTLYVNATRMTDITITDKIMTVSDTGEAVTGQFGGMGNMHGKPTDGEAPADGQTPPDGKVPGDRPTRP